MSSLDFHSLGFSGWGGGFLSGSLGQLPGPAAEDGPAGGARRHSSWQSSASRSAAASSGAGRGVVCPSPRCSAAPAGSLLRLGSNRKLGPQRPGQAPESRFHSGTAKRLGHPPSSWAACRWLTPPLMARPGQGPCKLGVHGIPLFLTPAGRGLPAGVVRFAFSIRWKIPSVKGLGEEIFSPAPGQRAGRRDPFDTLPAKRAARRQNLCLCTPFDGGGLGLISYLCNQFVTVL